ncbi:MAG: hypothetical protein JO147_02035 [Actinobacteria bacterium]|nr:hypothetical protein [Actinomycetota bacterium]
MIGAFDDNAVKNTSIGVIIGVVVIGLIIGLIVKAIVGRIIVLVVVVALGVWVWTQRAQIEDKVKKCDTNLSFFGFHVQMSNSVKERCQSLQTK